MRGLKCSPVTSPAYMILAGREQLQQDSFLLKRLCKLLLYFCMLLMACDGAGYPLNAPAGIPSPPGCRLGLASVLHVVVCSLEELFVERCHDLITTAALRAMGGCKKLKVCSLTTDSMSFTSQARVPDCHLITDLPG